MRCTDNKMWLAVQMDMYFRPFRTDNELDYLWFYGEVNTGDAADESMKTHISNVLMMITTC